MFEKFRDTISKNFNKSNNNETDQIILERQRLMNLTEKELMVEMVILLEKLNKQCSDIESSIIIWSR